MKSVTKQWLVSQWGSVMVRRDFLVEAPDDADRDTVMRLAKESLEEGVVPWFVTDIDGDGNIDHDKVTLSNVEVEGDRTGNVVTFGEIRMEMVLDASGIHHVNLSSVSKKTRGLCYSSDSTGRQTISENPR